MSFSLVFILICEKIYTFLFYAVFLVLCLSSVIIFSRQPFPDPLIQHRLAHTRIHTDPEGVVHGSVCLHQIVGNAIVDAFPKVFETRMSGDISCEKISCLYLMAFQPRHQIFPVFPSFRFYCYAKTKPALSIESMATQVTLPAAAATFTPP